MGEAFEYALGEGEVLKGWDLGVARLSRG